MSQPDRKDVAKKLFNEGETIAAIALTLGVSRRTIERWADEGAWREQRTVVNISDRPTKPKPQATAPIRERRERGSLDELETVEGAIATLAAALESVEDARSLGGIAGGLVRLLEYRRKVAPPTAAALAEQLIALGISPSEFVQELRAKWRKA